MSEDTDFSLGVTEKLDESVIVGIFVFWGSGVGFVSRFLTAGYLGPSQHGQVVFGLTLMNFLSIFALLGLPQAVVQRIPQSESEGIFIRSVSVGLVTSTLILIVSVVSLEYISGIFEDIEPHILLMFLLALPFFVLLKILVQVLRGLGSVRAVILDDGIKQTLKILFILLAVVYSVGVEIIILALLLPTIVATFVITYVVSQTEAWPKREIQNLLAFNQVRSLLSFSIPLMLTTLSWDLLQRVDNFLILLLGQGRAELGRYDVYFMIGQTLFLFVVIFSFRALPMFSDQKDNITFIRSQYKEIVRIMSIIALPFYVTIVSVSGPVLNLVSRGYSGGSPVIFVIATGFFIHILFGLNEKACIAFEHTRIVLLGLLVAVGSNVCLNFILIPAYGILGAGIASVISLVIVNLIWSIALYEWYGIVPIDLGYLSRLTLYFIAVMFIAVFYKIDTTITKIILKVFVIYFISFVAITYEVDVDQIIRILR